MAKAKGNSATIAFCLLPAHYCLSPFAFAFCLLPSGVCQPPFGILLIGFGRICFISALFLQCWCLILPLGVEFERSQRGSVLLRFGLDLLLHYLSMVASVFITFMMRLLLA